MLAARAQPPAIGEAEVHPAAHRREAEVVLDETGGVEERLPGRAESESELRGDVEVERAAAHRLDQLVSVKSGLSRGAHAGVDEQNVGKARRVARFQQVAVVVGLLGEARGIHSRALGRRHAAEFGVEVGVGGVQGGLRIGVEAAGQPGEDDIVGVGVQGAAPGGGDGGAQRVMDLLINLLRLLAVREPGEGLLRLVHRHPIFPLPVMDPRESQRRALVVGVRFEHLPVPALGLGEVPLPGRHVSHPHRRLEGVVAGVDERPVDRPGLLELVLPGEHLRQRELRRGVVGVCLDQLPVTGFGRGVMPGPGIDLGQLASRLVVFGIHLQQLPGGGDRLLQTVFPRVEQGEALEAEGVPGRFGDDSLVQLDRLRVAVIAEGLLGLRPQVFTTEGGGDGQRRQEDSQEQRSTSPAHRSESLAAPP